MKKSLLALAVAVAASGVVNAAVVYDKDGTTMDIHGRVMAYFSSEDFVNTNTESNDGNFNASSRIGLDLSTEINQYITAFAFVEQEWAAEEAGSTENRYTWVGLDFGQFGSFKVGKFEDAVYYVSEVTDVYEEAGGMGQLGNDDRRDGMFMYNWSGWGFDFNASYGTAKDDQLVDGAFWTTKEDSGGEASEESADIKGAWGVSIGYTTPDVLFGPISIRLGYGGAEFQALNAADDYRNNVYDKYNHYAASVSWGNFSEGLYLAAMWNMRSFDFKEAVNLTRYGISSDSYDVQGAEFVISYGFQSGVTLIAGFEWMNVDYDITDISDPYPSEADSFTIPVGIVWQPNANFALEAEVRFDAGTDDEFKTLTNDVYEFADETVFLVGAKYMF